MICECQVDTIIENQIAYNKNMEFSNWIEGKFLNWRNEKIRKHGKGTSVAEFARQFGVSQQLMSKWMEKDGPKPTHAKHISSLAAVYGNEVYEVLGMDPPSESFTLTGPFPPELKSTIEAAVNEVNSSLAAAGLTADSPAALELAVTILSKHGLNVKLKEN